MASKNSVRAKEGAVTVDMHANPKPWDYNPSAWHQRGLIALIAVPAFVAAVYMGMFQWGLVDTAWDPVFGEQSAAVLKSDLSHRMSSWFRVPDAVLGALAYLGDIVFALAGSTRRWQFRPWLVLLFGVDVIPLGIVSALLVVAQGTIVGSWCFLCLFTAVISLVLVFLAYDAVWSSLLYLHRVYRKSGSWSVFWKAFWGFPTEAGFEAGEELSRPKSPGSEVPRALLKKRWRIEFVEPTQERG